jgi:hypothetical protein
MDGDIMRMMPTLSRRELLLRAVPAGLAGFGLARAARAASACVQPESEALRASLNYVVTAADPAASCARCAFFTADAGNGGGCGGCQILSGPVDATGHCDSFSPPG